MGEQFDDIVALVDGRNLGVGIGEKYGIATIAAAKFDNGLVLNIEGFDYISGKQRWLFAFRLL
jgi:hypothetical protein